MYYGCDCDKTGQLVKILQLLGIVSKIPADIEVHVIFQADFKQSDLFSVLGLTKPKGNLFLR